MPLSPMGTPATDHFFEIRFAMLNGSRAVPCFVNREALDDIEEAAGEAANTTQERLAIFEKHRGQIESVASALFDSDHVPPRVTAKHIRG